MKWQIIYFYGKLSWKTAEKNVSTSTQKLVEIHNTGLRETVLKGGRFERRQVWEVAGLFEKLSKGMMGDDLTYIYIYIYIKNTPYANGMQHSFDREYCWNGRGWHIWSTLTCFLKFIFNIHLRGIQWTMKLETRQDSSLQSWKRIIPNFIENIS